ncbi:MAG TPA: 2-dehydropantoate 2-reductase [Xanthobacteraceae bacterium]
MKIVMMATGGVGGYYGARLAAGGHDVYFIARGAHLAALRTDGLKLISANGDLHLRSVHATDEPATVGTADIVIFAVKQYDTESVAKLVVPVIGDETAVISIQNGMDPRERLKSIVGREHVMGGTTYITGAKVISPGTITHTGAIARLVFGEYDGSVSVRGERFLDACKTAGIDALFSADIGKEMWAKFALLSAFSGVSSVLRKAAGPLMSDPDTRKLLKDAIAETVAVAKAKGIDLGDDYVAKHGDFYASVPPDTKSSTLMDLENGRRIELNWLSGAVAQFGDELGVPTPTHHAICGALKVTAEGRPA